MSKATYADYRPDEYTTVAEVLANVPVPEHLEVIGTPEDIERFTVGQELQIWLETGGVVFEDVHPHGLRCRVEKLWFTDDNFFYWMPTVVIEDNPNAILRDGSLSEARLYNPDHLREI